MDIALTRSILTALSIAGYAEPVKPRPSLNIQQRLSILRDHMSRRRSLTPCRVDTIWTDSGFRDIRSLYLQFVGGTFAYLAQDGLEVVELPSPNKGTALSRRTILNDTLPGVGGPNKVWGFWIYPDMDLLVLCCSINDHSGTVGYTLYLRTLSTNETHPSAYKPELHLASGMSGINVRFQSVMMLVHITVSNRIVVWNWMRGKIIFETTGISKTGVLLFDSLLLVARPNREGFASRPWFQVGNLEVYSLQPNKETMIHVGHMELPKVNWDAIILGVGTVPTNEQRIIPKQINLHLETDLEWESIIIARASGHTPGIFEVPNSKHFIQVMMCLDMGQTPSHIPCNYLLLIPVSTILRTIPQSATPASTTEPSLGVRTVPWSELRDKAHWIRYKSYPNDELTIQPFFLGLRGVLLPVNSHDIRSHQSRVIHLIELKAGFQAYSQPHHNQVGASASATNPWVYGSVPCISGMGASVIDNWLEHASVDKLNIQPNYFTAEFQHEVIDQMDLNMAPIVNWVSDEHMVIIEFHGTSFDIRRVVAFTF